MRPGADPLGPENILGFVTGPMTGTQCIEGNRSLVVCKSPLTGGWGDANWGGPFGAGLKFAGFDASNDTEHALQERHGKGTEVASIGPAGEKLVLSACIIND